MGRRLTILVAPINAIGHVGACAGTCSALLAHGHRVVFVLEQAWRGKLEARGYEERLYSAPSQAGHNTADLIAKNFKELGVIGGDWNRVERLWNILKFFDTPHVLEESIYYNRALVEAIRDYRPDLIISDDHGLMPAVYYSGVPWVKHFSTNPLFFFDDPELPPGGSGLPLEDRSGWAAFAEVRREYEYSKNFNDFIQNGLGAERYPEDQKTPPTNILTIYATPEEWNYPPLVGRPGWFNLEVFNKPGKLHSSELSQLVPQEFLDRPSESGKLIYVSMGSMGSIDLVLMRRLVAALSTTPHKYIVSKGPLHQDLVLGENQWGDRFLPQLAILPHMDAVITHGGNNTVTEVFALGKPMLLLPLFADQYDNAARLMETGWARALDPYKFTRDELVRELDELLLDKAADKRQAAAQRIQATDHHEELAVVIENLVKA